MEKICGIYRIAFLNGKNYIGQSVDIATRFKDHVRASQPEKYISKNNRDENLPVHIAMRKYGPDNYFLEILERCSREELDDKEIYWIDKYQSSIDNNGYNVAAGGQKSFALKREHHSQAKLTEQNVAEIKNAIKQRQLTFRQIAKKYGVCPATITHINQGHNWRVDGEKYPLLENATNDSKSRESAKKQRPFSDDEVRQIRKLRNEDGLTLSAIRKLFNERASLVTFKNIAKYNTYKDIKDL